MSQEFKKCLERGKIKRFSPGKKLAAKELKLAGEDWDTSSESLESLLEAKNLREAADYYGDFSELNSRKLVKEAEKFLKTAGKLLLE